MRMLVHQSGVFNDNACTLDQAQSLLVLAVLAAEQQRSADDVRGQAYGIVPFVLSEFQVSGQSGQYARGLQDAVLNTVMQTCRSAPWAVDLSLSLGSDSDLSAARVAALNLLAMVKEQNPGHCMAEAELRAFRRRHVHSGAGQEPACAGSMGSGAQRSADVFRGLAGGILISFVMPKTFQGRADRVLPRCGGGPLASGLTCPTLQGG